LSSAASLYLEPTSEIHRVIHRSQAASPSSDRILDLVILGAGPTGLEAALAAAEDELDFALFEAGETPAANIASWRQVRLFTPWDYCVSPRMRGALAKAGVAPPAGGTVCPTGAELIELALLPVARLPQIAPRLFLGHRAIAVARSGLHKTTEIGTAARRAASFRVLLEDEEGEQIVLARRVLDCTGSLHQPLWLGDGGIPAPGERAAGERILRRIPDLAAEPERWRGREFLLVGCGHSAQTAAAALAELARNGSPLRVHWVVRRREPNLPARADDPLPARSALEKEARRLLDGADHAVVPYLGATVERLEPRENGLNVILRTAEGEQRLLQVDLALALVGSAGDALLYRELHVHECYASTGPIKLSAQLLGEGSSDCLEQPASGVEVLSNPEPDFFILGSKSYGRNNAFLMRTGWEQVATVWSSWFPSLAKPS
jgi:thioredoxin reductase